MPRRIERKEIDNWEAPTGTVFVGRPAKWGNPYLISPVSRSFPSLTIEQCARHVVNDFEALVRNGRGRAARGMRLSSREYEAVTYPPVEEIRTELGGKDLACWCPLDSACHADVLLRIANGEEP